MKIGFLAMSGIRAHDPELLRLGLTLPGFVERSKTVASLPSLGLLYLAAATPDPDRHELRYFEAEADRKEPAEAYACDLVAISTFSAQVFEAYAIADRLRAAGVKVAMGGLHVSVRPEEAARHADYVIVGEGDNVWAEVVRAAEQERDPQARSRGLNTSESNDPQASLGSSESKNPQARLRYALRRSAGREASAAQSGDSDCSRTFDSKDYAPVDVAQLPVPRYDLLEDRPYNRFTVQTSRGCPWRCDFCASNVMLGRRYRKRPVEHVVRDIRAIQRLRRNPFIEFADDNTFVDKAWGRELCRQLAPLGIKWFTETDITVADDDELLTLMRRAGCRQVLIGLESPVQGATALQGLEMRANAKAKWAPRYLERLRKIQAHGITVNGCFILGLDGHGPDIFEQVLDFALEVPLFDVQITVLTPFPGTPLHERLMKEGRILRPGRWDLCTLFDVNYRPSHMTAEELAQGMRWLTRRLYSAQTTERRRGPFFEQIRGGKVVLA